MTSLASRQEAGSQQASRSSSQAQSQQRAQYVNSRDMMALKAESLARQESEQNQLASSMTEDELTFLRELEATKSKKSGSGGLSSACTSVDRRRKGGKIDEQLNEKAKTWGPERLKEMNCVGGDKSPGAKSVASEKTQAMIDK